MEELLRNVKILLSVSIQQLSDEEIKRVEDSSDVIWNTIDEINKEKDLTGIEMTTAVLAVLHQLIEFIMEITDEE